MKCNGDKEKQSTPQVLQDNTVIKVLLIYQISARVR